MMRVRHRCNSLSKTIERCLHVIGESICTTRVMNGAMCGNAQWLIDSDPF